MKDAEWRGNADFGIYQGAADTASSCAFTRRHAPGYANVRLVLTYWIDIERAKDSLHGITNPSQVDALGSRTNMVWAIRVRRLGNENANLHDVSLCGSQHRHENPVGSNQSYRNLAIEHGNLTIFPILIDMT